MKNLFALSLTVFFTIFSFSVFATTYYLSSSSGNDNNSGTDASSPWRTIDKLNSFNNLRPGDYVLFRRGDTFYGGIKVNNSGSSGNPITFGAYGSGNKPVITGFTNVTSWTNLGGNIWESSNAVSSLSSLKMVVINGVNTPMGRYPNASSTYPFLPNFFNFQSHSGSGGGNTSITSSGLTDGNNWTGADVVVRVNHWTLDKETITNQSGHTISYNGQSDGMEDDYGFFIQNDSRTLDVQNEWYFNPSTKKIRIYSNSTPNNVQVTTVDNVVYAYNKNYISFDNLDFQGANTIGINIVNCNAPVVTNCNVSYTGENGLEVDQQNYIYTADIENNYISNSGSSSIFTSGGLNMVIKNNTVVMSGVISVIRPNDYSNGGIDINTAYTLVQNNKIDSSSYGGIVFRGTGTQIRNNFINHSAMVRDDVGGIYAASNASQPGKVIDGNIVLNSVGNPNGIDNHSYAANGIQLDGFNNNMVITNNTIAGCRSAGLFLSSIHDITVRNNTIYDNRGTDFTRGGLLIQGSNGIYSAVIRNNTVTNNIFFAKNASQRVMFYYTLDNTNTVSTFGTLDSNYYAKPIDPSTAFSTNTAPSTYLVLGLSEWQSFSGKDVHSKGAPKTITDTNDLRFEYNASTQSKTIALDANYIDVKGNNYNGSITLAPYSSAVLIKNGKSTSVLLPAVNPSNTVNGLDYKYFESGNYNSIPDFSQVTPVKTGNVDNFDLTVSNRDEQFAMNFTGYINVPSDGQYTFYSSSDDGSNLYIDGIKVVDNDGTHAQQENSGIIGLKAGMHAISVGFFQQAGGKALQVSYSGPGVSKQQIPASALYRVSVSDLLPAVNPSNTVNGLDYKYFESGNYNSIPDFSQISPIKTGTVDNFDLTVSNRAEQFAINFAGYINVPSDGQYTFYTSSDDGSNLYIDGIKVVNNDGTHAQQETSGVIGLKAGMHAISVGFFQQAADKSLQVSYAGPGVSKQQIPSSALYRVSGSDLLAAVNSSNTANGLNYQYFESGNYKVIPDFSQITPVKTGAVDNFDISVSNRAEQFAINFTGYINVPSDGQYTFYTSSDDGSNLYIDGIKVVDNDGVHPQEENSGVIGLKAGMHAISVGFFQQAIDKSLQVSYSGPGVSKQQIPSSALYRVSGSDLLPAVNPSNTANGLNYQYFESGNYRVIPDFSQITPIKTGTVDNFDLAVSNRAEQFAINFTGYINVPSDGKYTFYTSSDDGSNLYIDGIKIVVDNDGVHPQQETKGVIGLKAGMHAISVGFFQQAGDKNLQVSYAGPGFSKQQIPSSALYRVSSQNRIGNLETNKINNSNLADTEINNKPLAIGLDNVDLKVGVKVYPNPFINSISVRISGEAGPYNLLLIDAAGRTILRSSGNKNAGVYEQSINTSQLQRGIYFLQVIQNGNRSVIKLEK